MVKCSNCGKVFPDDELIIIRDDPSPSGAGICLPPGYYTYVYCPNCESDHVEEGFHLVDKLDLDEGPEDDVAVLSYGGKRVYIYLDDDGDLSIGEVHDIPEKPKGKIFVAAEEGEEESA